MTAELTPEYLLKLGKKLDELRKGLRPGREDTERDCFIEKFLKIRTKTENRACFRLNRVQEEYSWVVCKQKAKRNLVLKARQVGITTYIAARFFVQTITQPGTLSMQVMQDRESAEDIFRIVRRFWENLPDYLRKGHLRTSYRNARQLVFPRFGQRVLPGFGGGECGAGADDPESALLGGFAVGPRRR